MTWVIAIAAACALVAFWMWWTTGSVANALDSPAAVMNMLQYLMNRGADGATLRLRARGDKRRQLVYTKSVRGLDDVSIRSAFCAGSQPDPVFDRLTAGLEASNVHHEVVAGKSGPCLHIDYGRDLGLAAVVANVFFARALQVNVQSDGVGYLSLVTTVNAPHLTGVDAPDST